MTLFAALTKSSSAATACSSSPPEAIQLHCNTFIDFVSGTTVHLDDDFNKNGGNGSALDGSNNENLTIANCREFAALSYQAVQTQRDDVVASSADPGASILRQQQQNNVRPDLGIWDCRVKQQPTSDSATALLLQRVIIDKHYYQVEEGEEKEVDNSSDEKTNQDTFTASAAVPIVVVLTVDTSNPELVQPSMERMRHVILKMMSPAAAVAANNNNDDDNVTKQTKKNTKKKQSLIKNTTSMKVLQSSPFGLCKITELIGGKEGSSSLLDSRVAVIIAAVVSSSIATSKQSTVEEYKLRQTKSLILYHLHKFALETNCTLCFVRGDNNNINTGFDNDGEEKEGKKKNESGDGDSEEEGVVGNNNKVSLLSSSSSCLSVDELGKVIRRVAMGLSPVEEKEEEDVNGEGRGGEGGETKMDDDHSNVGAIYPPGSHDSELIYGAFLRNASCEGQWDASKDDLIVALPARSVLSHNNSAQEKHASKEGIASVLGGDEEWLSKLAASVGLSPEAVVSAKSGDAAVPVPAVSADAADAREKSPKRERPKRTTRVVASKSKDGKPKDQKEVMTFFDDLLKK